MKSSTLIRILLILTGCILIGIAVINLKADDQKPLLIAEGSTIIEQQGFLPMVVQQELESPNLPTLSAPAAIPDRILISSINLDAPIVSAENEIIEIDDVEYIQVLVPEEFAAGWHLDSAPLGEIGNTVISGHHNAFGEVFKNLHLLDIGDTFEVFSGDERFVYIIGRKLILEEKEVSMEQRLENARWLLPSNDERLTLVTCWPAKSNTHRLILVAVPYSGQE